MGKSGFWVICLLVNARAFAIDFAIDLPQNAGREGVENTFPVITPAQLATPLRALDVPPLATRGDTAKPAKDLKIFPATKPPTENRSFSQPAKKILTNIKENGKDLFVTLSSDNTNLDSSFPLPSCLTGSVAFWELVYGGLANDQVIYYDRAFVGRVYGISQISKKDKKSIIVQNEKLYQNKLQSLLGVLNQTEKFEESLMPFAQLFPNGLLTEEVLRQAVRNIRSQSGVKGGFFEGVQKSLNYLPMIFRTLKQEGVPLELAYLPHVESSFNNHALSHVGAQGLWQIMPGTMQLLLGKNAVGYRTNPAVATLAAAKLLRQNFLAAKNWPLAITAYNHGMGGIERAIKATGSRDICQIIGRYNGPGFGFASSNFYAQFLAARNIAQRYYTRFRQDIQLEPILRPLWPTLATSK